MKVRVLLLILVTLSTLVTFGSGDKYEIKVILSPTFETMRPGNRYYKDNWGFKLSYNYGLEYKYYLEPDISISTGVLLQDKGFRVVLGKNETPSPLLNNSVFSASFKYLIVPTNFNFHFKTSKKSRLLFLMGLSNGYLLSAKGSYSRVSNADLKVIKDANNGIDPIDNSFNMVPYSYRRYTGVNVGFKLSRYIKSKMIVELGVIYSRQLNRASRETQAIDDIGIRYVVRPKFDSYIFDLRIGYFFNKQIKNQGKNF